MSDQQLPPEPPTTTPPAATTSRLTRVEILGAALAVTGAAVVTLAVLTARGEPAADMMAARAAGRAVRPPAAAPVARKGPGWVVNPARWVGTTRKSVAFELPADNRVSIWMRDVRPLLVVRCLPSGVDAFVFTESAAQIEAKTEDHSVRFRIDDEPEVRELWQDSAEHDALFAPDGAVFARRLITATTLRFGFTPHNAAPVTAHFEVSGLRDFIDPAAKACRSRN